MAGADRARKNPRAVHPGWDALEDGYHLRRECESKRSAVLRLANVKVIAFRVIDAYSVPRQ